MELSPGEKMVWAQVFTSAMTRGSALTDAGIEAMHAVYEMRKLTLQTTWENVPGDERQKHLAVMFALAMTHRS